MTRAAYRAARSGLWVTRISVCPEEIGELLLDLNSSGQTLILVTHNPDLAARYARRVIEIVDGRVASDAATGARR